MPLEIQFYVIEFATQMAILLLALWIMIKVQKLDYNFLGLLATAALGSGLDMIPYAGHYIAIFALHFCIWKLTRADLFPDVGFTVVVAYALMFAMNLFLLGALMGDLRTSAGLDDESEESVAAMKREGSATSATNQTQKSNAGSKEQTTKPGVSVADIFSVKGVTISPTRSMTMIHTGVKDYTIGVGETLTMQTSRGRLEVKCEKVDGFSVILNVAGEQIELFP